MTFTFHASEWTLEDDGDRVAVFLGSECQRCKKTIRHGLSIYTRPGKIIYEPLHKHCYELEIMIQRLGLPDFVWKVGYFRVRIEPYQLGGPHNRTVWETALISMQSGPQDGRQRARRWLKENGYKWSKHTHHYIKRLRLIEGQPDTGGS